MNTELADELENLCCAETEGKFFDCVTDNIATIVAALRSPAQASLRSAAERYMTAVKRLAEESGYNRLTYFEAPILDMPTEETKSEAYARWMELNNAGVELTKALAALPQQDRGGK